MLKRVLHLCATLVLVAFVGSCLFDPEPAPPQPPPPAQGYLALTTREAVLNNLEVSYNRRHPNKYEEVLDDNFTMFFSEGDVSDGKTPEQWGRPDEVGAIGNLFNPNYTDTDPSDGIQPRCTKITMDVKWEDGVQWQEITPSSAPSETWYTTTVFYNFQFDIEPDLHLINNPSAKAQFTVRNKGTESEPEWQLVEFRDLDGEV